ncbi:MAG: hypothetical protein WCO60_09455 [Verrucomicrobiota bacterium]
MESIRALTHADLANGAKVHSLPHLELVRGGLFYAVDALGPAHAIFQENHTALGSYWHGMMHRREGDFGNACYWFRKAGALPVLRELPGFDPVSFTMACERARANLPEHLLLQKQEWETLMLHCLRKALGSEVLGV